VRWNVGKYDDGNYLIIKSFKLCKVNFNGLSSEDRIISIVKV